MVGLVERAGSEGVAEVARQDDLGPVAADHLGQRPPQRHAVLDDPVGQPEELHGLDADDLRRLDLLGLAHPAALVGMHPVDAGLAAGHHHVGDVLALAGPAGDGGRRAELHVVGVGDDRDRLRPVLGQGLQGLAFHGQSIADTRLPRHAGFGKGAAMVRISELDPADETTLRAFWEVEQASVWHDREHAIPRSWDRLWAMVAHPNDWYQRTLLVAREDGHVVGLADLGGSTTDNLHLADLQIHVRPERRRRGIGRALYDEAARRLHDAGRFSVCSEVHVPPGSSGAGVAAYEFAVAMGFEPVHTEDHLLLDLPVGPDDVVRLRAKADAAAYDVLTWTGPLSRGAP